MTLGTDDLAWLLAREEERLVALGYPRRLVVHGLEWARRRAEKAAEPIRSEARASARYDVLAGILASGEVEGYLRAERDFLNSL